MAETEAGATEGSALVLLKIQPLVKFTKPTKLFLAVDAVLVTLSIPLLTLLHTPG